MEDDGLLRVSDTFAIPRIELSYRATRSGGPGGQHVNTSSTRIELTWNLHGSSAPTEEQRARLQEKLAKRVDADGNIRLVSSGSRSQHQNRLAADTRLVRLLAAALRPAKPRRRTRVPRSAREARLRQKRERSQLKQGRGKVQPDD